MPSLESGEKMKTIQAKKLTVEGFARYGSFVDLLHPTSPLIPKGQPEFYSDLIFAELGGETTVALSVGLEERRQDNIIEFCEFHRKTGEGIVPLDGDVIIYCAPPTEKETPPFEHIEAFLVPAGTAVTLRRGVWHGTQFPVSQQRVSTLILLPERTYAEDCVLYFFAEEEKIRVE